MEIVWTSYGDVLDIVWRLEARLHKMQSYSEIIDSWFEMLIYYIRTNANHEADLENLHPYRSDQETKDNIVEIRAAEQYTIDGIIAEYKILKEKAPQYNGDW